MIVTEDMYKSRNISTGWVPYCEMTKEERLKHPDADLQNGYFKREIKE